MISNFFNHHQKPLADELYNFTGHNYNFIETEAIPEERLNLGWGGGDIPQYVLKSYTDNEAYDKCQKIIDDADVVIIGNAPHSMVKKRLLENKLTFFYSERLYKSGYQIYKWPVRLIRHYNKFIRYKSFYMLCASAYGAADFAKTFSFLNKTYKWGYFTELKQYDDVDQLIANKKHNSILWAGRFLELKHPEAAVYVAQKLKSQGYDFVLNIIGNGALYDDIQQQIKENHLEAYVNLLGVMKPEQVREHMEQSEIFLFTSDKNEGWGAVLNEAMNSGCAVVASETAGATNILISDGINGRVYKNDSADELCNIVLELAKNPGKIRELGLNAYKTMLNEQNAKVAAERFSAVSEAILEERDLPEYATGPMKKIR
jgi:glycosyltransferase involved in cell wall biosynthesis